MKTLVAGLFILLVFNLGLSVLLKIFNWVEPHFFRFFFKKDFTDVIQEPEFQERSAVRKKYTHWFWSVWLVLFFALSPLNGLYFYLALAAGLVLYFVGSAESNAMARIETKYREKEFIENLALTEKFFTELTAQIKAAQEGKKDVERN